METCPRCGARVTNDATWCGQCFASIPVKPPAPAPGESGVLAASRASTRIPVQRDPAHVATYSRWKKGATSFGPVGRILLTILTLIGLVIGYPILRGLMLVAMGMDVPGSGFFAMYLSIAITGGLFILSKIWRPSRIS
jgi:hypothetical protein